jgi:hypothetical protein
MRVQQGPHAGVPDSPYTHDLLSWKDSFRFSLNAAASRDARGSSTLVVTLTMALWPGRSSSRAAASSVALAEAFPALSFASGLPAPIRCALRQVLRRRIFPRASSLGERAKRASFALALARHPDLHGVCLCPAACRCAGFAKLPPTARLSEQESGAGGSHTAPSVRSGEAIRHRNEPSWFVCGVNGARLSRVPRHCTRAPMTLGALALLVSPARSNGRTGALQSVFGPVQPTLGVRPVPGLPWELPRSLAVLAIGRRP